MPEKTKEINANADKSAQPPYRNENAANKNESITKIIHYIWLGGKPKPESVENCIASWRKFCPDYQIMEWNETNVDLNENLFVRQAVSAKKWAFASDVVRLFVLLEHGGIYMDTDMELFKPLDEFLDNPAFFSFENKYILGTAIIGSVKNNPFFKKFLDYYQNRPFLVKGKPNTITNVDVVSALVRKEYGTKLINGHYSFKHVKIYPSDYFYPKHYLSGKTETTPNTAGIHHYAGTWISGSSHAAVKIAHAARKIFGEKIFNSFIGVGLALHAKRMYRVITRKKNFKI